MWPCSRRAASLGSVSVCLFVVRLSALRPGSPAAVVTFNATILGRSPGFPRVVGAWRSHVHGEGHGLEHGYRPSAAAPVAMSYWWVECGRRAGFPVTFLRRCPLTGKDHALLSFRVLVLDAVRQPRQRVGDTTLVQAGADGTDQGMVVSKAHGGSTAFVPSAGEPSAYGGYVPFSVR